MNGLKIVFMGTPDFATASLKELVLAGSNIVGVITAPDRPAGRGQKLKFSSVKQYALANNLNLLQPKNLKDPAFIDDLKNLKADLQVVVAFRMLPKIVWNMPKKGTFNLHGSLLPNYRGAAPINWAIINGDKESGVTTFFIEQDIDTGNVIFQEKLPISENETAGELHDRLMNIGSKLVCKTVLAISEGKAKSIKQKGSPSHAPKLYKHSCQIDWGKPSQIIHNKIRGLSPYPAAWTTINKTKKQSKIEISKHSFQLGQVITDNKSIFKIATSDGFVHILELQLSGKKRMGISDFLRGYKPQENSILE
jgi:methionyl-tRNA formyltransferase